MSRISDKDFFVVKFVGSPRVIDLIPYKCIHKSWIVTRTGNNVMVACPLQDVVSLRTHAMKVTEVYPATLEYETDDVTDGIRFANEKTAAYVQGFLLADHNTNAPTLRYLLQIL